MFLLLQLYIKSIFLKKFFDPSFPRIYKYWHKFSGRFSVPEEEGKHMNHVMKLNLSYFYGPLSQA